MSFTVITIEAIDTLEANTTEIDTYSSTVTVADPGTSAMVDVLIADPQSSWSIYHPHPHDCRTPRRLVCLALV